ncbi:MAG: aminotransferase class I/II-fold pyridoxal phosphate-dependent enzyme [Candidatus Berkelbacteria bacterium]|nr:aminotransferase class I/II-fold pyridoxal phosphate-dependent enzyme [Candidatus Berkelbacteria bacterium]
MNEKNNLFKNVGKFRDNNISYYVNKYTNNDGFYNLGWGNLSEEMIKYIVPKINFDKNLIGRYNDSQGTKDLLDEIVKFVNEKSGLILNKENILITNGVTSSIFLLGNYFKNFHNINTVLLQNPTYDTAINIFRSQDYDIKTTDPNLNDNYDKNIELAYLMFKFQNPTGLYIEKDRAKELKENILKSSYLIEDDSYGLLEKDSEINIIKNNKYVYLSSFSKYIFPGLRLGYIVADVNIINNLKTIQKYYMSHPNILSQIVLFDYFKTGKIYNEINNKIRILDIKNKLFENSLSPKIKNILTHDHTGFYYWLKLPKDVNLIHLFIELLKNKVFVIPGDIYFVNNKYNALRVCLSPININDIPKAAKILSKIIENYV